MDAATIVPYPMHTHWTFTDKVFIIELVSKNMTLFGVYGDTRDFLIHASNHIPCLIVDCTNTTNPYTIYPQVDLLKLRQMYVMNVELIYSFRDIAKKLNIYAEKVKTKKVFILYSERLFNYDNNEENINVYEHSWELLLEHSKELDIFVLVTNVNYNISQKFVKNGSYCLEPKNCS